MIFPLTRLNEIFKNRIPFKGIVSVYGDFGVGKTTFSLQTLINTIKSNGEVLFIYTKNIVPINRLKSLVKEDTSIDFIEITDKVIMINLSNFEDLRMFSFNLELFLMEIKNKKGVHPKLLIVDSMTDLYRINLNRDKKEINIRLNYQLNQILANLLYLNQKFDTEILIVNDITRINQDDKSLEIQSGGQVMNYWTSLSIKISRTGMPNQRTIEVSCDNDNFKSEILSSLTESGFG